MDLQETTPSSKCGPVNRRYATWNVVNFSPLHAGRRFGRTLPAQPCSPAAVARIMITVPRLAVCPYPHRIVARKEPK
jgi:hypothetical protein